MGSIRDLNFLFFLFQWIYGGGGGRSDVRGADLDGLRPEVFGAAIVGY